MFTITLNIPQDVLNAGGGSVAMPGQLLAPYTPAQGPSSGAVCEFAVSTSAAALAAEDAHELLERADWYGSSYAGRSGRGWGAPF